MVPVLFHLRTEIDKRQHQERCRIKLRCVLAQKCEHKLQEHVAHVPASRSDNVCVRLSSQSGARIMEENCNERGPSQLADVTNVVLVWSQCTECGELRVVRKWLVIRWSGM